MMEPLLRQASRRVTCFCPSNVDQLTIVRDVIRTYLLNPIDILVEKPRYAYEPLQNMHMVHCLRKKDIKCVPQIVGLQRKGNEVIGIIFGMRALTAASIYCDGEREQAKTRYHEALSHLIKLHRDHNMF
jgi:hypothetical protein